jgi:tripartite-type tricarboxylate transporter receptor subunit TctC
MIKRTLLFALALAGAMPTVSAQTAESKWPERTILLIQPYAPGTATDASSRYIANQISEKWKVPLVMDHRAGANGIIGTELAVRAAPDGYTFMITSTGYFTNEAMVAKLPYDPLKSFIPVAKVGAVQLLMVVPSNSPFSSVKGLIEFAKANPGKVSYASGGNGSSQHLAGSMLSTLTGAQFLHVPYKGQVPAAVGTATGEVNFSFAAITTARPLITAGKIRILAASGARRSASYPDTPTVAEAGVPGYDYVANTFYFAPANTPISIVQKFSEAIGVVARGAGYKEFTASIGMEPEYLGHAEWSVAIPAERQRWLEVVRASGAKGE